MSYFMFTFPVFSSPEKSAFTMENAMYLSINLRRVPAVKIVQGIFLTGWGEEIKHFPFHNLQLVSCSMLCHQLCAKNLWCFEASS